MVSVLEIVFRTDASFDIGTGHVMRCLTLAEALAGAGVVIRFVCRDLPGHLGARIEARGFTVDLLTGTEAVEPDPTSPRHAHWLPVGQVRDADQTLSVIGDLAPDWVVVDHYALDARWERKVRPHAGRIMAIDDLADRPHEVDLLLDQNLGRVADDYDTLIPAGARRLIGPRFALLAPQFAALRAESLDRRVSATPDRLLIAMGGVDQDNVTGDILTALSAMPDLPVRTVDVVLGSTAPWLEEVRERIASLPIPGTLHVDTPHMAELMTAADIAIGAAGSTSWERCCLGLPTLLMVLAENQAAAAHALAEFKACIALGRLGDPDWQTAMTASLVDICEPKVLTAISQATAAVCDGAGTVRVVTELLAVTPCLRRAEIGDAQAVYAWRNAVGAAQFYRGGTDTSFEDHVRWFTAALVDPDRILLIAEERGTPVGHLRFDRLLATATVSICIAPEVRGRSFARTFLNSGIAYVRRLGVTRILAEVHVGNTASVRLFEGAGFRCERTDGAFITYVQTDTERGGRPLKRRKGVP